MRWHKEKMVETDGILRHPTDTKSWKEFNRLYETFVDDPRNIRLGLATDDFNLFENMSNAYSIWPVLIAPGKEIDVYLHPLINKLKELWDEGVETYDASTKRVFRLYIIVMWTIHDFSLYGIVSGWSTKSYKVCPICLEDTTSQNLRSKICYTSYRWLLHLKHSWCKNKSINEKFENEGPPRTFSDHEILTKLDALPEVTFSKHPALIEKRKHSVGGMNWVKKHNLDVMHIEKNICDALVSTLFSLEEKSKNTINARLDMQDMGIRSELHLSQSGDRVTKPHASYTFTLEEKCEFCYFLKFMKFPDGYAANISRNVNVNDEKLYGLKTYDCHVLLQRLLRVAIRKFLPKDICGTIVELCDFFKKLTSRTLHVADLNKMGKDIVFILCKMERIFPPAFFYIMVHLAVHLPCEAILSGPVSSRWMYPFERPEGSIVEGYVVNEAFTSLYMDQIKTKITRSERNKDVIRVMGSQRNHKLSSTLRKKAHWYVLNNCKEVDRCRNEHLQILSARFHSNNILQCHEVEFPQPNVEVRLYDACIVNGVRYHTISHDTRWTTQNSGVNVPSSDDGKNLDFFEVLKDVVILFYVSGYKFGLTFIDTSKIWYEDDPFILATQAKQVYYLDDIKRKGAWKVVQKVQYRKIYEVTKKKDDNSDEFESQSSSNNESNQEISSDEISLLVRDDLEIPHLCIVDTQPQYVELLDTQSGFSEDMHNFINDEDDDTELESNGEKQIFLSDDDTD
ncbi:hypothetical protein Pfo_018857 [Paulownia fortunei]|nr:hypothetical protein Pfo_018857 [Paulownia fortunei]